MIEMKNCQQPRKWHTEGDVWAHTKLALGILEKQGQLLGADMISAPNNPNMVLALLWHDLGKPATYAIKDGRITFYGHEQIGAKLASRIIKRLKLESAGINRQWVKWLIRNHMLVFNSNPARLRNTTIEKYFFSDRYPSKLLLTLIECDARASVPAYANKVDKLKPLRILKKRLSKIGEQPPKPLLSGREVMKILDLTAGPRIGKILRKLREAQLGGKIKNKQEAKKNLPHYSIISRFSRAKSEKSRNRKTRVLKGASNKRSKINKTIL
jgi:poly(A) polymerase